MDYFCSNFYMPCTDLKKIPFRKMFYCLAYSCRHAKLWNLKTAHLTWTVYSRNQKCVWTDDLSKLICCQARKMFQTSPWRLPTVTCTVYFWDHIISLTCANQVYATDSLECATAWTRVSFGNGGQRSLTLQNWSIQILSLSLSLPPSPPFFARRL